MTETSPSRAAQRPTEDHVHLMFGLTYANYLVLHRSLLQSMPDEWQERFCTLMEDYHAAFDHIERPDRFRVSAVGEGGRFTSDPVPHYNRGRTFVPPQNASSADPATPGKGRYSAQEER